MVGHFSVILRVGAAGAVTLSGTWMPPRILGAEKHLIKLGI
jgi:hypothetical protein